ncbi:MAG: esterase [Gammaproteobacteria bacterium]
MNLPNIPRILLLASLLTLTGCAYDGIYRSDYQNCAPTPTDSCESHSIQLQNRDQDDEYLLGFVEIDDQGQLRDRKQMKTLLDTLYETAANHNLLINVFVHGWHHNAAPGDSNVEGFKISLANLSKIEHEMNTRPDKQARKVIGIYVGWRGESIDFPGLRYLTFWDRKNTAQDVGYLGITELFLKLEEISNIKNTLETVPRSRLVITGHSFGGAAVYNASAQILTSRFIDSRRGKTAVDTAKGFGDLIVLLNPAFEAIQFSPLFDLGQSRCSYFDNQRPRLAILTSRADYATRIAFPAGRIFSTLFETHDTIERNECGRPLTLDEGAADRWAVGHFEPLVTHTLTPAPDDSTLPTAEFKTVTQTWSSQSPGNSTRYGTTILTHLNKTLPLNPYLNIQVSKEIISGHNDVFGEDLMEFIRRLIVLSTDE